MAAETLTDLSIRNLLPAPNRYEVFDKKTPGFAVRVSPKGVKTFVLLYRFSGRQQRLTLGRFPILSLKEARRLANDALNKAAHGLDPQKAKRLAQARTDLSSIIDSFATIYCAEHNRASTAQETLRLLRSRFVPLWGTRDVTSIAKEDVTRVLDRILANGTPSAANHALAALRKLFNWCVERGLIEVSPCASIPRPSPIKSRDRVLSDQDLAAIWNAAATLGYPYQHIVHLLILTAQRRGEVVGLKWQEINFSELTWSMPGERTKNGIAHSIPLSSPVCELLKCIPRIHPSLLFPARGNDETTFSGFSKLKAELDVLSGVSDWTLHDLRRTAATGMARLGVAPHVVERLLNHVSGSFGGVAGIYNRFQYAAEVRAALDLWAQHVRHLRADRSSAQPITPEARPVDTAA